MSFLVGLAMLVACSKPTKVEVPEPVVAEPCRSVEGPTLALSQIDTLMWHQPDSALAVMMEFAGSTEADSLNEFNGHYCQVLVAELLFKNDYGQSNREELLKAVGYFDSIVGLDGVDVQKQNAFIGARAHYINGVGFYEKGDVVNACAEYLKTLEVMEAHFEEKELVKKKAIFMTYTYNRLMELFSTQFMMDPAIECGEKALMFCRIEPTSSEGVSNILYRLGKQYDKMHEIDKARQYYELALENISNTDNMVYRDIVSSKALCDYELGSDVKQALDKLDYTLIHAKTEKERLNRYLTIGGVFFYEGNYDSAIFYLKPVFENNEAGLQTQAAGYLRIVYDSIGDVEKSNVYMRFLTNQKKPDGENKALVSKLNDLFQQHLQWKQGRTEAERQQAARLRRNRMIVVVCALVVVAGLLAWLLHRRKMRQQRDAASQQMEAEREAHRLEKASMSGRLKRSNQELRELKDQMRQQAGNGAPKQEAQAVSFNDEPICRLIMERVNEGQFKAQMDCKLFQDYALGKEQVMALREAADRHFNQFTVRLAKAYPNLTKGDLDYCCLYLLGLSDADISALMQRAYNTVSERSRKLKGVFGSEESLSVTLRGFASESASN